MSNKRNDIVRKLFAACVLVVIGYTTGQLGIAAYGVSQVVEGAVGELHANQPVEE